MWRIQAFDRDNREVAGFETQGGEVTIGREADRSICLPSPSVSRRHAKLVLDPPQPYVMDEGSANGVLVNGVRISGPTAIVPGVRVDIAEFHLEFVIAQAAPPPGRRPSPVAAPAAVVPNSLRLSALGGPFSGQVFEIPQGHATVGRAIDNDLVFDDPSLSRKHCRLRHNGDHLELEDLQSSNGTFVNGERAQRSVARVGDEVRFGELYFRLEGDRPAHVEPQQPAAQADAGDNWLPPQKGPSPMLLYGGVAFGVVVVGLLLALVLFRNKKPATNTDSAAQIAVQVATHLKAGKDKLEAKDFVGAVKEFDQTIELDPSSAEARRLKSVATAEPQNDQLSRQAKAKAMIASSRADLEAAIRIEAQIPPESVFHDTAAQKVASKLVAFGLGQCKGKKYADCGWAVCRAWDIVPVADRATTVTPDAEAWLREAEKKLARDRSYTPCKKH